MNKVGVVAAMFAFVAGIGVQAQDQRGILYGTPAATAQAERSITLAAGAKWVNVKQGETVKFMLGNVEFAWRFDGRSSRSFDLREIAPTGSLASEVTVYVAQTGGHRP